MLFATAVSDLSIADALAEPRYRRLFVRLAARWGPSVLSLCRIDDSSVVRKSFAMRCVETTESEDILRGAGN